MEKDRKKFSQLWFQVTREEKGQLIRKTKEADMGTLENYVRHKLGLPKKHD